VVIPARNLHPIQVQISQGTAVYELLAIKPAATPSFDEIRSRVESDFKNERSQILLAQKIRNSPTAPKRLTI